MTQLQVHLNTETLPNNTSKVHIIFYAIVTISLLGQLFTILTYKSIRNKNNKFFGYVAWHAVLGFPWLISYYFTVQLASNGGTLCKIAGFINAYCYSAYMLWTSVIAWAIYSSLKSQTTLYRLKWQYIAGVYGISLLTMSYAIYTKNFGPYKGVEIMYCWFEDSSFSNVSMALGFHIPLVVTTLYNLCCYIASSRIVSKNGSREARKEFYSLFLFPFISLVCNSGAIVKKVSFIIGNGYTIPWEILHIILGKGQGLYEALAYGFNKSVQTEIKKVWCAPVSKPKSNLSMTLFDETSIENEIKDRNQRMAVSML